jgi:hypothetical protein
MIPPVKDQRDQPVLIPIDIEDYLYFWSPGLVTGCWVYAFYLAEGFHTVGTQAVNAIAGAPNARALLYAGEMASTRIPGNYILAAVAVVRQFNWVHMNPWPNDWMSRGTFNFDPTRWREHASYTGPYRDQFLPMVRTLLQDQTNRALPH